MSSTQQELTKATSRQELAAPQQETAMLQMIERASTDPNVDVEKMERLMQMYERFESREAEKAYNIAFAELQTALPDIQEGGRIVHRDKQTGEDKIISTYGRWDEDINPIIKPILNNHGFALSFRVNTSDKVVVEAVLSHEKGHSARTDISLPADTSGSKNPVQAVASSVSYGKRYTACSLLNISTYGADDDGQKAGAPATITEEQAADLQSLAEEVKANKGAFLKYLSTQCKCQITSFGEIPETAHKLAASALEAKRKAPKKEEKPA